MGRDLCLQGVDGWDVDLPTNLEANVITNVVAKVCWVLVYIGVYGLRPVIIRPKPIGEPCHFFPFVQCSGCSSQTVLLSLLLVLFYRSGYAGYLGPI